MSWSFRPATTEDDALLRELYRTSRLDEVRGWGWGDAEVEAFLSQQWELERRTRPLQYPDAEHLIIVVAGRSIGRLLIDRSPERVRLVDMALLPETRDRGLGTDILNRIIDEARPRPVDLSVVPGGRPQRLCERLGFQHVGDPAPLQQLRRHTV